MVLPLSVEDDIKVLAEEDGEKRLLFDVSELILLEEADSVLKLELFELVWLDLTREECPIEDEGILPIAHPMKSLYLDEF